MKLYEYSEQFVELKNLLDQGKIDDQQFKDNFEAIEMDADEKAENTLKFYKNNQAEVEVIKAEVKRLNDMKKSLENKNNFLEGNLETYYKAKYGEEKGKVKLGTLEIGIKSLPAVVKITDEMELPEAYVTYEPKADKTTLKKLLQDGENIPGAELEEERMKFYVK